MKPGEVDLVTVGCSVFDCEPDVDPDTPITGGIVWSIDSTVDRDTGEIVKAFATVEPWRDRVRFLTVAAADVRQWNRLNSAAVRSVVRRMARVIATGRGALDSTDLLMLDAMSRLVRAL